MSLLHWWPLNGNTKDLGLNPVSLTNNGATVNSAGKIGSCYKIGTTASYLDMAKEAMTGLSTEASICFWLKITSFNTSWATYFQAGAISTAWTAYTFGLLRNSDTSKVCFCISNGSSATQTSCISPDLSLNTWYHFTLVYKTGHIMIYINGALHQDFATSIVPNFSSIARITIGKSTNLSSYQTDCSINDFRIYDHALSAKEVKEISKGLVLHYNFEEMDLSPNIFDIENYLDPSHRMNTGTKARYGASGFTITATGNDLFIEGMCYSLGDTANANWHLMPVEEGKSYRISYELVSGSNLDKNYICYFNSSRQCVGASAYNGFSFLRKGTTNKYYYDFTVPTGYSIATVSFRLGHAGAAGDVITAEHWQLRRGTNDTEYTPADFSSPKIPDNSGYGYNGINNGVILSDDSISGKFSAQFASNAYIEIPTLPQFDKVTYSMWVKMASTSGYKSIFIPKNSPTAAGIWLSMNTERCGLWTYHGSNSPSYCKGGNLLSGDTWYLYTHTYDGTTGKNYLNGQLYGSAVTYTGRTYVPAGIYTLGDSYTGTSWSGTPFDGQIADFKIFATVLSAEDILAEYNRKAAIDKNGNLFTGEIIETDGSVTKIDKNNFVASNLFATTMTLDDGSIWAPICVHYIPDGLFTNANQTLCYVGRNIWTNFGAISDLERPESDQWEFYVMQQSTVGGAFSRYRFKQNVNPMSATWDQVNPSKVGTNVTRISGTSANNYAGMYWYNTSSMTMCFANTSNGNWFGCGARAYWGAGYTPGYNGEQVRGWQLVYMRINKHRARLFKNGVIIPTDIVEN